jgi:hypothetical protein
MGHQLSIRRTCGQVWGGELAGGFAFGKITGEARGPGLILISASAQATTIAKLIEHAAAVVDGHRLLPK